jgi:regulator of protease activity HflC (stomatin/prohibitin superfamily)
VPQPSEVYPDGVQKAKFLDTESAILVLNESTGQERLVADRGVFFPSPEEEILETRRLIRTLPHEVVVVRDDQGAITIHSASQDASKSAFFLPPYSQVVVHDWSSYSEAPPPTGPQESKRAQFTMIDMRVRQMFFRYEVRTSDNVKLSLEGTIFWRVDDVPLMINVTSDPEGDVWHHARSALIQAVSQTTLQSFMKSFNNITMEAFNAQSTDGFYSGRGCVLTSMELTKFETTDPETAQILQQIIQESTNRVNRLAQQKGENEVKAAELTAEILLETQKTQFIEAQAQNKRLEARMQGEAAGMTLMRAADSFIGGLNETVDNVTARVDLYKLHETLVGHNADIHNLASGQAELYLTPDNVNLKLGMGNDLARRLLQDGSDVLPSAQEL